MQQELFPPEIKSATTRTKTKTIAMIKGDGFAGEAIKGFAKDTRVTGLTNGKFSLISLIRSVLDITGAANVIISTWSAGFYDANAINDLITCGKISDLKIILDRSFKTRQEQYSHHINKIFRPENIRTTDTHSKYVLIWNDEWNVCIRSSMNLNENKRCENFDLDNDTNIFNLFKEFSDELFAKMPAGIIESREIVDPVFDSLFEKGITKTNFETQNITNENDKLKKIIENVYTPTGFQEKSIYMSGLELVYELSEIIETDLQSISKAMDDLGFKIKIVDRKPCYELYVN